MHNRFHIRRCSDPSCPLFDIDVVRGYNPEKHSYFRLVDLMLSSSELDQQHVAQLIKSSSTIDRWWFPRFSKLSRFLMNWGGLLSWVLAGVAFMGAVYAVFHIGFFLGLLKVLAFFVL